MVWAGFACLFGLGMWISAWARRTCTACTVAKLREAAICEGMIWEESSALMLTCWLPDLLTSGFPFATMAGRRRYVEWFRKGRYMYICMIKVFLNLFDVFGDDLHSYLLSLFSSIKQPRTPELGYPCPIIAKESVAR